MTAPVFVDTHVLVYARDATAGAKQRAAANWMHHLWTERAGRLSYQVLQEFYVTVTLKLSPGLEPAEARDEVRASAPGTPWGWIPGPSRPPGTSRTDTRCPGGTH